VQTKVKPDGSISLPLVGRVQASGPHGGRLADEVASQLTPRTCSRSDRERGDHDYNSRFVRVAGKVGRRARAARPARTMLDVCCAPAGCATMARPIVVLRRAGQSEQLINTADSRGRSGARPDDGEPATPCSCRTPISCYSAGAWPPRRLRAAPWHDRRQLIALAGARPRAGNADKRARECAAGRSKPPREPRCSAATRSPCANACSRVPRCHSSSSYASCSPAAGRSSVATLACFVVATGVAMVLPKRYQATARVLLDIVKPGPR
jgi:hypothetical protein